MAHKKVTFAIREEEIKWDMLKFSFLYFYAHSGCEPSASLLVRQNCMALMKFVDFTPCVLKHIDFVISIVAYYRKGDK